MSAEIHVGADGALEVSGELDFQTVPPLRDRPWRLLRGSGDLVIDLGGVTRANSAGLVLLLEWLGRARAQQRGILFRHIPESLRSIAKVSNVADLLPVVTGQPTPPPPPAMRASGVKTRPRLRSKKRRSARRR